MASTAAERGLTLLVLWLAVCGSVAGCQRNLMPTPLLLAGDPANPFAAVAEPDRSARVELLYATDRAAIDGSLAVTGYGPRRGAALILGQCTIAMGPCPEWDWQTVCQQTCRLRRRTIHLDMRTVQPLGPLWTTLSRTCQQTDPSTADAAHQATRCFIDRVNSRLEIATKPDLFLFVHGFNTDFCDSAYIAAELWHFLGRQGVPIVYSWPSRDSILWYSYDRESALFSAGHFRQLVELLMADSAAQRIHIISHSTGAALVGEALRELQLLGYDAPADRRGPSGRDSAATELGHWVLVAPDIDPAIFKKRILNAGAHRLPQLATIYVSPHDRALNFAARVVYGLTRLGVIGPTELGREELDWLATQNPHLDVVAVPRPQSEDFVEHRHHTRNPAVSSDLILLLRHDMAPAERGLSRTDANPIWQFPHDYSDRLRRIARRLYPLPAPDRPGPSSR